MQPHRHSDISRMNTYTNMQSMSTNDTQSNQWNQNDKDGWNRSLSFLNTSQPSTSGSIFTSSSPSLPPLPPSSSLLDSSRFYPMSSSSTSLLPSSTSMSHSYQPYPTSRPKSSVYGTQSVPFSGYNYTKSLTRPRLTTILWEDESTICYQVDCRGICVARRQDNDMINGTKLLNVAGMSRGKRDGILKNERGRIVVKVGAMHLKGVWIPFVRAKALATQFKIYDALYPIFSDDPASFLYPSHFHQLNQFKSSTRSHLFSSDSGSVVNNLFASTSQPSVYYRNEKDQQDSLTVMSNDNNTEYSAGSSSTPVLKRFKPEDTFLNTSGYYNNTSTLDSFTTKSTDNTIYPSLSLPSITSPTTNESTDRNERRGSSKPIW